MKTIVEHGKSFRTLIGVYPYGTDQSSSDTFNQPNALRETMTIGVVQSGGKTIPEQMQLNGHTVAAQTGTITVANNTFTDLAEIILGGYRLLANVDFVPGVGVNDTAIALAATINQLSGFSATSNAALVLVSYEGGSASDVDFRAMHYGAVTNFTLNPTSGLLTKGSPQVSAPIIT